MTTGKTIALTGELSVNQMLPEKKKRKKEIGSVSKSNGLIYSMGDII